MSRLYIYGDSIAYGAFDEEGGWVQRLRVLADRRNASEEDYCLFLYNLGVSGDTAEDILERFEPELLARRNDDPTEQEFFLFAVGVNDSQYLVDENKLRFTPEEFSENLRKLIKLTREYSAQIGFMGLLPVDDALLNPMPWAPDKAYRNELVEKFNQVIGDVCKSEGLIFIDLWNDWIERDYKALLADGVHPNSEGHRLIAAKAAEFLVAHHLLER